MLNGTAFDWNCFKNQHVSTSINEAEFFSIFQASKSVVYYLDLFTDFGTEVKRPVCIFNDNNGAVKCANHGVKFDSRDFSSKQLKVIERTRDNLIKVIEISERDNVADMMTKFLDVDRFRNNVYAIGLINYDQRNS